MQEHSYFAIAKENGVFFNVARTMLLNLLGLAKGSQEREDEYQRLEAFKYEVKHDTF